MIDRIRTLTVKNAVQEGNLIRITFPYNIADIAHIKEIPGRRFIPETKSWTIPISQEGINLLIHWGFTVSGSLQELVRPKLQIESLKGIKIPGLGGNLYPFQNIGVSFIEDRNGRALIADEMGLGKTVQALAWLQLHPEHRPAIIVCPASLKLNWQRETNIWIKNPHVEVLSGEKPYKVTGRIIIINYDILSKWIAYLLQLRPKVLILDEIHFTKSATTQRTKAVKKLGKTIPYIIGLSGTPIVNRPVEIFNAVNVISPTIFPVFWKFVQRYCNAHHNGFGWDFNGATNTAELHDILVRTIMIRRLKKDVLLDLPEKVFAFRPMELDNREEYRYAERDFIAWVKGEKGMIAALKASKAVQLAKIEGLKQIAVRGKIKQAVDWITDFLETGEKLLVFAHHRFVVDALEAEFKSICVKFVGGMNGQQKDEAEHQFQNNPKIRLFIGNIQAAGVGLTLTAASNVAFLELPWTPGALSQCADRVHRIGQRDAVTVHYLLASNTIEEKMALLIDGKRKIMDAVLDGKASNQENLIGELIKMYLD